MNRPLPLARFAAFSLTAAGWSLAAEKPATPESPPLTVEESLKGIHVPPGFVVDCVAHEPEVLDPVAIDWGADGRLWVVEMADYPLGMDGKGMAGGRIRRLKDADGDGRYEKATLFAEGLNFPTGILAWRDGVLVTAAPDIVFLKDTDGDGKADVREVLWSGLSQGNQQLRANGLRWGLDGWVYCAAGGHHGDYAANTVLKSSKTGQEAAVGSRDFRLRPDTGEVEPESGPSQFGRNRDDWGHWFGTQNSRALWQYLIADRYLKRNADVPTPNPTRLLVTPLNAPVWPASRAEKRFHSYDNAGHFTSACSGMIYRDEWLLPRRAGEMDAFTCEPFHNLVQHNVLTDDGISYAARRAGDGGTFDFFASEDRWCRPVMTRTGPDGALWIVDMYRYMIEHPDWLPDTGKAELLPHYRLGDDRGRIYRLYPKAKGVRPWKPLAGRSQAALIEALGSPNEWERDKAQMLLSWQIGDAAEAERAAALEIVAKTITAENSPLAVVHAMGLLAQFGSFPPDVLKMALAHPHPRVREVAILFSERQPSDAMLAALESATGEADEKTLLQLVLTLGEFPSGGAMLAKVAARCVNDTMLQAAVISSAGRDFEGFAQGMATGPEGAMQGFLEPLTVMALKRGREELLEAAMRPAFNGKDGAFSPAQMELASGFLASVKKHRPAAQDRWLAKAEPAFEAAGRMLRDESVDAAARLAAGRLLLQAPAARPDALKAAGQWLDAKEEAKQRAGLTILAESGDPAAGDTILERWEKLSDAARTQAIGALLGREAWSLSLLKAVQAGAVTLDATQRSQVLHAASPKVREQAGALFQAGANRKDVVAAFQPALALKGDPSRGKSVFLTRCSTCHRLEGVGQEIGPNLVSVAAHPAAKLLVNILDPNVDVQPGFHAWQARLTDGTELFGLLTSETANSLTFRLSDGTVRLIPRSDVASAKSAGVSLMPEGLEAGMSHQDLADLISCLKGASPEGR